MSEEPFTTKPIFLFHFPFKDLLLSYTKRGKPDPYLTHFHSLTHNLYMTSQRAEKRDRERPIFLNSLKDLPTPMNHEINTRFQVFVAANLQTGLLCSARHTV